MSDNTNVQIDTKAIEALVNEKFNELKKSVDVKVLGAPAAQDEKFGYKHIGEVLRAQYLSKKGLNDDARLKAISTYSNITTAGDGGNLVPQIFVNELFAHPVQPDPILSRTKIINWSSPGNVLTLPVDEESAAWATGGPTVETRTEGQAKTAVKDAVVQRTVSLTKYSSMIPMSDEYLADTFGDMLQYRIQKAVEKIEYLEGKAVITAITGSSAKIAVNCYSQGNLYWVDVLNMYSRVYGPYRSNMVWLASAPVEAELLNMSFDPSATAGIVPTMLYQAYAGNTPEGRLLGKPIVIHGGIANLGTDACLIAADLTQVVGFRKGGMKASTSEHFAFDQDMTVLKVTDRFGAATWSNAVIVEPSTGVGSQSAFIAINY
jgi:HK97 family phage major capsid protein